MLQRFEDMVELLPRFGEPVFELRQSVLAQHDLFDKVLFCVACRLQTRSHVFLELCIGRRKSGRCSIIHYVLLPLLW